MSTNDRPSFFSKIFRHFPRGSERKMEPHFARSGWTYSYRHACGNFRAKNRRSDVLVSSIKQNLAEKLDPTLQPNHLKETTYLTHFYAPKSKCPSRFYEIDPEILHVCSTCLSRGLTSGVPGFFSSFFFCRKYM